MSNSAEEEVSYEAEYEEVEYEEEVVYEYEEEYEEVEASEESVSSDWSDDSSSEEEEVVIDTNAFAGLSKYEIALIKWGKREEDESKPKKVKVQKEKSDKKKKRKKIEIEEDKGGVKKVAFDPTQEYEAADLYKLLDTFSVPKGRKPFGDAEVLSSLDPILKYAEKFIGGTRLELMSGVFFLRWNVNRKGAFERVQNEVVFANLNLLENFCNLFVECKDIPTEDLFKELQTAMEHENLEDRRWSLFRTLIYGCEELDNEILKGYKLVADEADSEYEHLHDLNVKVLSLMWRIVSFSLKKKRTQPEFIQSCTALVTRLSYHLHYLEESQFALKMEKIRAGAPSLPTPTYAYEMIQSLVKVAHYPMPATFSEGDKRNCRKQELWLKLMLIFTYAQADKYREAVMLLRGGDIFDQVAETNDVDLLIFMNRAVVACGLVCFRIGKVQEAHNFLQEICSFSKQRELLAQALPRLQRGQVPNEDDIIDKRRLLPIHMHISSSLVEVTHYICAMFIISPIMARQKPVNLHVLKSVNKHFVHMYDMYMRQQVTISPESDRDIVMLCLPKLCDGKWLEVIEILSQLDEVDVSHYKTEIAKIGLRCFVSKYAGFYQSMLIDDLADRFKLTPEEVTSVAAQLLAARHINGTLNEGVLLLEKEDLDVLRQNKALMDKITLVMDSSEALYAFKRQA